MAGQAPEGTRNLVARAFTWVEDIVYVGLGVLLAVSAIALLGHSAIRFSSELAHGTLPAAIINLLEQLLLVLMIVELLYTVQVSFREHTVAPEPFLIVGLVAVTRRLLVLTAELPGSQPPPDSAVRASMLELGVLTLMIVGLVGSLLMLRHRGADAVGASRA